MSRAGHGRSVHDGVRHRFDGIAPEQIVPGDHADHAAGTRNLARLLVGQVPLVTSEAAETGVRGEQRPACDREHVGERAVRAVRHVDEHSQLLAATHQLSPERRQPRRAAQQREERQPRQLRGLGHAVVHEMRQREVTQAPLREALQLLQRPLDVVPSFRGVDHRHFSTLHDGPDIALLPGDLGEGRVARAEPFERG